MFFIYDIKGLQFSGDLASLKQRRKVESISNVRKVKQLEAKQNSRFAKSIKAYVQQEHRENVEPLVYAYEMMSEPVLAVYQGDSLHSAWDLFQEHSIRHLPVLNQRHQILGVISDRDVLRHLLINEGNNIVKDSDFKVEEVIRREAVCAQSRCEIRQLASAMVDQHIGCIPIIEDQGHMIGIVTRGDILKGFVEHPRLNLWG